MAINFSNEVLGTKILCNQVSTECCEVGNLISRDPVKRSRGFVAESFVRAPVDILLQFPCPVNIFKIVINACVGSQRSTGFELFAQREIPGEYDAFNSGVFSTLGKYYSDSDHHHSTKGVCIVSSAVRASSSSFLGVSHPADDFVHHELNGRQSAIASVVWSLRLRIIKTAGSSIPSIGGLDTWGYVAYSCPAPLARDVLAKWHSTMFNNNYLPRAVTEAQHKRPPSSSSSTVTTTEFAAGTGKHCVEIPEEFLDGLTYEIMAMPVRLPSGNVIDERTLDRFTQQEASWGRSQSDPFTGQPFNSERRPIFDSALKARIDAFLLLESHKLDLNQIPRTCGPIQRSSEELFQIPSSAEVPSLATYKRPVVPPSSVDPSRRFLSHLASNLQQLTGTSSRSSRAPVKTSLNPIVSCCSCDTKASSGPIVIYTLPCTHHICRTCLLNAKTRNALNCSRCEEPFGSHQPVLCHSV